MPIIEGQDSLFLLALFVAATVAMDSRKELRAGSLVGLTLFKFQYALPVVILFLLWRRWRFLAGVAISASVVLGVSVWLVGFSGMLSYLHALADMSANFSDANRVLYEIHPEGMPNLRGLAYVLSGRATVPTHWITVGLSAVVFLWAAFKRPSLPGALLAALLVSYHQIISDTSLLVAPLGLILAGCADQTTIRRSSLAVLGCVGFIGPAVLLFTPARFYLLAVPVLGLYTLWDGTYLSHKKGGQGISRPQKETN